MSIQVHGLKDLHDQLVALGNEMGRSTLATAARRAFRPVLDAAIARVPVDSGLTRDNIKITVKKPRGAGDTAVVVGLAIARAASRTRADGTKAKSPHFRWHFIELGTAHQAAQPFLRPALDGNVATVLSTLRVELDKAIKRAVRRKAKAARAELLTAIAREQSQ